MKRIGVLFGMEHSFPGALVERINAKHPEGIEAEFVLTGAVPMAGVPHYAVIIDRISHDIPFYRAFLKHAALNGTTVINNPFWWSADDKFFNYALAQKLGVAVPPTVILPHKVHPRQTTDRSMRNLEFPLDWEAVFAYVGEHGFMKPVDGGGWRDVHHIRSREEFFRAYDQSRDLCMMYQKAVDYSEYFRCYVVGQKAVRIMPYDPRRPHADRYVQQSAQGRAGKTLLRRIEQDALTLCRALGYDLNSVEFAVQDGIPYAIDFMNPVPDADLHTIGPENFEWIVEQAARLALAKARSAPKPPVLRWSAFLGEAAPGDKTKMRETSKSSRRQAMKPAKIAHSQEEQFVAEEESAAADAEPMGSIAAAVPGNDKQAEDAMETGAEPGAESPVIPDPPKTTAGTEAELKSGGRQPNDTRKVGQQRKPGGKRSAS